MLMVIIINKKGFILCQKDGVKVYKNSGKANLGLYKKNIKTKTERR